MLQSHLLQIDHLIMITLLRTVNTRPRFKTFAEAKLGDYAEYESHSLDGFAHSPRIEYTRGTMNGPSI